MRISDWSSDVCASDLLANQLSASLTKIAGLLSKSIFAELVKVRASADAESLRALFSRASLLAIITGILIAIIVVFIVKPLLLLLAGPAYEAAYPLLVLLGIAADRKSTRLNSSH